MKREFSTSWNGSVQVRKQRKYRYNAPLHLRHSFLNAHLSKELKKKYGKRSVAVRKGDEVLIMRGNFSKKKGKVIEIDTKKSRVVIENINRAKKDGSKVNVYLSPSNLQIVELVLDDARRLKRFRKGDEKKETKPIVNTEEKKQEPKKEELKTDSKPKEEEKKNDAPKENTS